MNHRWKVSTNGFLLACLLSLAWGADAQAANQISPDLIQAAQKEGDVIVYTTTRRGVMDALAGLFQKQFGIKVTFTRKQTGAIVQMVTAEKMAGRIRFDVVSTGDESVVRRWLKEGLLVPYKPRTASLIPDTIAKNDAYLNYGIVSIQTVIYSAKRVPLGRAPKDWVDLLHPRWKGRIAMADPRTAGGTRTLVRLMVDKLGWSYFEKLAKNEPLLIKSQAGLDRMVLSGGADVALSVAEADALLSVAKGEPIGIVYPKSFTLALWLNSAVAKNAPHPHSARLWQDFSLTTEAQTIYSKYGYNTSNPDTPAFHKRPKLTELELFPVDAEHLRKTSKGMLERFEQIMKKARD